MIDDGASVNDYYYSRHIVHHRDNSMQTPAVQTY